MLNPTSDLTCERLYRKLFSMFRSRTLKEESIIALIILCFINYSGKVYNKDIPSGKRDLMKHLVECEWTITMKSDNNIDVYMNIDTATINHSVYYSKKIFIRFICSHPTFAEQQAGDYFALV